MPKYNVSVQPLYPPLLLTTNSYLSYSGRYLRCSSLREKKVSVLCIRASYPRCSGWHLEVVFFCSLSNSPWVSSGSSLALLISKKKSCKFGAIYIGDFRSAWIKIVADEAIMLTFRGEFSLVTEVTLSSEQLTILPSIRATESLRLNCQHVTASLIWLHHSSWKYYAWSPIGTYNTATPVPPLIIQKL